MALTRHECQGARDGVAHHTIISNFHHFFLFDVSQHPALILINRAALRETRPARLECREFNAVGWFTAELCVV